LAQLKGGEETKHDAAAALRVEAIRKGELTLLGAMHGMFSTRESRLLDVTDADKQEMKKVLKPFFQVYDMNRDGTLSAYEFGKIMVDLGEDLTEDSEKLLFKSVDVDQSGSIDFEEFLALMIRYVKCPSVVGITRRCSLQMEEVKRLRNLPSVTTSHAGEEHGGEEEEDEEMPEDLKDLSPEEQQRKIKLRAAWGMALGTILVLIFSDPAVEVLNDIGKRTGIPGFYISFILAPLASNASELVAAYNYGAKKTSAMMTVSLSTLEGAACMNNTFFLAIFFALVWLQKLVWVFTAETASILVSELIIGLLALRKVQTSFMAMIALAVFPASLAFVYILQNVMGIP
jgi:Ca2+/Na+ antiporter